MDKETFNRLVGRIRGHVSGNKESYKTTGIAAATGGGAAFVREHFTKNVEFFQKQWWAEGAAMAVGGHFVARKNKAVGHALAGVGGFLLAEAYMANQAQANAGQGNTPTQTTAANFRTSARGMDDASDDASALVNSAFTALPEARGYDEASAMVDVSGLRDTDFTSDAARTRSEASAILEASADADASDALDL
jgi:hypothetical protein